MTSTLSEKDRADIQADLDFTRESLELVENVDPERITDVRGWYRTQELLRDEIRDLEKLL